MDPLDAHLEILLQEFTRACSDTALQQEDWRGLYEICLYAHDQDVAPPVSSIRDYLVTRSCSLQKAAFSSQQYGHLINILTLRDQRQTQPLSPS